VTTFYGVILNQKLPLPKDFDDLKANIEREIKNISPNASKNVILYISKRCDLVIEAKGGHINNVL